jgi:hypothetical protein
MSNSQLLFTARWLLSIGLLSACTGEGSDEYNPDEKPYEGGGDHDPADEPPRQVEEAFPGAIGERRTGTIDTADGPRDVEYEVIDGLAVFEGDIILGHADEIPPVGALDRRSAGRSNTAFRWPNGVVPYEIGSGFGTTQQGWIQQAIDHWNANTPYWFRPRNGEADFVRFVPDAGCSSPVGKQSGNAARPQLIKLAPGCNTGSTIHEMGHAVGLWHEQTRADRDSFVTINWANIQTGKAFNFQTYAAQGQDGRDLFDYDYRSIMHYPANAFSSNGQPTIVRNDGQPLVTQNNGLSPTDISGAVRLLTHSEGMATFKLVNENSGKCLDVGNWSRQPNAWVNQFSCHGGSNQRWYYWLVPGTSYSLIINEWSGQCLDIAGWSLNDGVRLQQFPCHGFDNQQFSFSFFGWPYRIQAHHSGKCLDVAGGSTADGARVNQFTCHLGPNQQWRGVY